MTSVGESELRGMGREIQTIERSLGIDKEAERAREGPLIPLHAFSQTPMCTPRSVQEGREERWDEQATIRRKIRALYFSTPDIEVRRLLIRKTRQLEALHKVEARDDERRAEAAVIAAMDTSGLRGFHFAIEVACSP